MAQGTVRPLISLASQTFIYGFGVIGSRLVVYLSIPLLTANMGMDSFGIVAVLISLWSLSGMITNAGFPSATFRLFNDDNDPENHRKILGSSLLIFIVSAMSMSTIVWLTADVIALRLLGNPKYIPTVRVVAILLLITTLIYFAQMILRIQVRLKAKVTLDITLISLQALLSLTLVIVFSLGALGYWVGQLIGGTLGLILAGFLVIGNVSFSLSRRRVKELLHFGLPLLPAAIGLWGLQLADRSIITASLGLSEVAIYEVGYKVGMITGLLTAPFAQAWPQFAFSRMYIADAARIYRNVLSVMAASTIFLAIFVISFRNELISLMAPDRYGAAAVVVPWIALSQVAWTLYPIFSIGSEITKKTILLAFVTLVACLVNIGMNLLLIPRVGIVGAAIATFVGYWVLAGSAYIVGNRHFKLQLDWKRLAQIIIAACLALIMTTQVINLVTVPWHRLLFQLLGLAVYPITLLLIGFVTRDRLWEGVRIGLLRVRTTIDR